MKKIFSYLLAVSVSCTFSFRKMEESGVFKCNSEALNNCTFISEINKFNTKDLYDNPSSDELEMYLAYIYDKSSGYGFYVDGGQYLISLIRSSFIPGCSKAQFSMLQNKEHRNLNNLRYMFNDLINDEVKLDILHPKAFFIKFDKEEKEVIDVKSLIQTNKEPDCHPLYEYRIEDFKWSKEYISDSGVKVLNTGERVKLSKTSEDKTEQVIDFQESLKNYVRKNNPPFLGKKLFQTVLKLKTALENKVEVLLNKEIIDKNKVIFTDQEKDLLENSEILAVWHLAPATYSTKEYRDHEKEVKASESNVIHRLLIGFAVDKRDNRIFHWVTDLGADIEVLFDDQYASVISEKIN